MSAERPHSKNIAKDISRKKVPATGSKGSDKQLPLPFDEIEVPTMESAKRKLEASKSAGKRAVPGRTHSAKAVFGAAEESVHSETKGARITPYASESSKVFPTSKSPKGTKASGGGAKFQSPKSVSQGGAPGDPKGSGAGGSRSSSKAGSSVSANSTKKKSVPADDGRESNTVGNGIVTGGTLAENVARNSGASGTSSRGSSAGSRNVATKGAPRTSGSPRTTGASAKASKEFSPDAEVYGESSEGVDFRSRASRSASLTRESRGGNSRRLTAEQEAQRDRDAMLGAVKNQVSYSRRNSVEPDVPLHAGPGPTMENRKKTASGSPQKRVISKGGAQTKASSRGSGRGSGVHRIASTSVDGGKKLSRFTSGSAVNGMEIMILVVVILAVVLTISLVVVFIQTGRTAEKRVPVIEGSAAPALSGPSMGAGVGGSGTHGGQAASTDNTLLVEIRAGMTARQVCQLLESQGIVSNSQSLLDYLVAEDLAGSIRQGSFLLRKGIEIPACANAITSKPSTVVDITIFPGYTIEDIDRLLTTRGYADAGDFVEAANALAKGYGLSFSEGWFLSGIYQVPRVDGAQALAMSMYQATLDALHPLLGDIGALDRSVDDVLIVASMIQRETNNASEMPLIAGIIYKRLDEDIALGIDATTRYETGNWTDPIDPVDLETLTPYNTRRKKGLPPSGIGCVGIDALQAAVYPSKSDWYYYLHGTDGRIHFARTYDEHKENISMWR